MRMNKGSASLFEIAVIVLISAVSVWVYIKYIEHRERKQQLVEQIYAREQAKNAAAEEKLRRMAEEKAEKKREEEIKRAWLEEKKRLQEELLNRERHAREMAEWNEAYEKALDQFDGAVVGVLDESKVDEVLALKDEGDEAVYIFEHFEGDEMAYSVKRTNGVQVVKVIKRNSATEDMDKGAFDRMAQKELCAVAYKGNVWIRGIAKNCSTYSLPKEEQDFCPAQTECGGLYTSLIGLGADFDVMKCRVSLIKEKSGEKIVLGIISYDGVVRWDDFEEEATKQILAARKMNLKKSPARKWLKKYKQTVVFYGGNRIKKDIHGVTYVPRVPPPPRFHRWRRVKTLDDERERWLPLALEAQKQEDEAVRIKDENESRMRSIEREELRQEKEMARVGSADLEKELAKWRIMVDRGKIKKRANE